MFDRCLDEVLRGRLVGDGRRQFNTETRRGDREWRAGRRGVPSVAILVAQGDPLDQYLVSHPDDLFAKPPEAAVIDPTNPYVVGPHLACAAREQPLSDDRRNAVRNYHEAMLFEGSEFRMH